MTGNFENKCYNQPLAKNRKNREENMIVTINLSNINNVMKIIDSHAEKKLKANNPSSQKKNYRSNSEIVKKEEVLNTTEILECENSFLSDKIEELKSDNKDQYLSTQKTNRNNEGLQIYRKENKNKNYPLKIKQITENKDAQLNLQQQYNSSNKQKFMSHDFLRKKGRHFV